MVVAIVALSSSTGSGSGRDIYNGKYTVSGSDIANCSCRCSVSGSCSGVYIKDYLVDLLTITENISA